MRNYMKYLAAGILLGTTFLGSCHDAEMIEYSDVPRICFIGTDNRGNDSYDATTLGTSTNFGVSLKGDTLQCDTLKVIVRLMGDIAVNPLKVYLSSEALGDAEQAEFEFFNPYIIEDSSYRAVLKVGVKRPAERNKEYKANLIFDFAQSDVASGLDSLLRYPITVTDEVNWEILQITEDDWEYSIAPYFGPYSDTKVRFMITAMKTTDFSSLTYSWMISRYLTMCQDALNHYNEVNPGNPLKDENGNLITFDPA